MLAFLNRYLPAEIASSFKKPLQYFIHRQQGYIEAQLSLLQLKGLLPPVPPTELQKRVAGISDGNFFRNGNSFIDELEQALGKHRRSVSDFDRILDFGTGCGRVLIPLSFRVPPGKLYGTDIDRQATDWLSRNYPIFGGVTCNNHLPPLPYADNFFDLLFSVSVFTHLPEDMQFAWLDELRRVTAPNGYVLLSFHGDYATSLTNAEIVNATRQNGFYYTQSVGGHTDGLPDFYQEAFHTQEYIRREWGKYFEVLDLIPRGMGNHQDLAVLRKRER